MPDRTFRRHLGALLLLVWAVYAASATGTLSIDPYTRFSVAENLLRNGSVELGDPSKLTVEHEGRHYCVFFPGQSVTFLPFAAAGRLLCAAGVGENMASITARFAASVLFIPGIAAFAVVGHVRLLRLLGTRPQAALASGMMLAFGTYLWVWATDGSEEAALGACGVWTFVLMLDARRCESPRAFIDRFGLAGLLLAAGLAHRSTFMTIVLAAAIVGLPILVRRAGLLRAAPGRVALWLLGAIAIVGLVPLYDWMRFGDPFDTGYARFYEPWGGVFENPLWVGLRGHLLSPGKSVFLYVPWLLLVPVALLVRRVRARLGLLGVAIGVAVVLHLAIYATHTFWSGAFGWGVRFHVSLLPLVLLPAGLLLDLPRLPRAGRFPIAALAALSIVVQLASNALNAGLETFQRPQDYTARTLTSHAKYDAMIPEAAAWTWEGSPLRLRFVNIADRLRGASLLGVDDPDDPHRIRESWNLFPLRAATALGGPVLVPALWIVWSAFVALALAAGFALARGWRSIAEGSSSAAPR